MNHPNNIDQVQQQQSAQLAQLFVADEQKRKQQKGSGKNILENFVPYGWLVQEHYDLLETLFGKIIQSGNLIPTTTLPSIIQAFKIQTSFWKDGTFVAKKDIISAIESLKHTQNKEDLALKEKEKNDQSRHEQEEIRHKSFQQHGEQQQHENQNQHHRQQEHDDSLRNYWREIHMTANQARMNITNKNSDDFDMLKHYLQEQDHIIKQYEEQARIISHINDEKSHRKHG
jgi:hypothetical protein